MSRPASSKQPPTAASPSWPETRRTGPGGRLWSTQSCRASARTSLSKRGLSSSTARSGSRARRNSSGRPPPWPHHRAVLRRGCQGQVCLTALREEPAGSNLAPPMSEGLVQEAVQKDLADLGASFAELICGRTPVLGGPPGACAKRLRRLNPGLSRPLADILERCLTTDSRPPL